MRQESVRPLIVRPACLGIGLAIFLLAPSARAVSPDLVISQVYGGAGCGTAGCSTYKNDFIEVFNRSGSGVDVNGWSVQYAPATSGTWQVTILPNVTIPAGGYLLVAESFNTNGTNTLPTPDVTGSISMSATTGKIAVVHSTVALGVNCPSAASYADLVGYGTTPDCFEGATKAPAPSTTTADIRAGGGCTDTDVNGSDFTAGAPNPRSSLTAVAPCGPPTINLSINDVAVTEGNGGTVTATFTVSLTNPAGPGGVTFDITTADNTATTADNDYVLHSLLTQNIAQGGTTYTFDVTVNGDVTPEANDTYFVNVSNVVGVDSVADGQGLGTINDDDGAVTAIHDVQGNGATTPMNGSTVTVEGVAIGSYQGAAKLSGFFLQEENANVDGSALTSEGIFVYCGACAVAVTEGQRVRVTGSVSEFFGMTEITSTTVIVTEAGNHLAEVTAATIDLPVVGVIDDYYEPREGMLVTFTDQLSVGEYFELARFGQLELFEGGRPRQFTEGAPPNAAGLITHEDRVNRRRVILDDDNDGQNVSLTQVNGSQFIYHPRANGGFSVGTQGTDFFRGGDLVNGLTGVLEWAFNGFSGTDAWRVRPVATTPAAFTVANPRPATPPAVGGSIKAVGMNLLNYFTTIDITASDSTGPCGATGTLDCRGADSVAELNRQRARAALVICALNADVFGFMELENTTASATITDLLGAVNTACGGAHPYTAVSTGGTLGSDAIRVQLVYRSGVLAPVGTALVDLDPINSRPPTAQTFDVVDATNPALGQRFTVVANHFKSKGCGSASGADLDQLDGQGCYADKRTQQATRLLTWLSGTVIPAAGDPDVLLLGDLNSYAQETPITTLTGGGFTDLETSFLGPAAYSYLFGGELGHLDYGLSSASLTPQVTGAAPWHINADESDLFDYNDETRDTPGEAAFEEKPDGSSLAPPRNLFAAGTPYRASDHDPVVIGLFAVTPPPSLFSDGFEAGNGSAWDGWSAFSGLDAATSATAAALAAGTAAAKDAVDRGGPVRPDVDANEIQGEPGPNVVEVPTLGELGLVLLGLSLASIGATRLRRRAGSGAGDGTAQGPESASAQAPVPPASKPSANRLSDAQ